MRLFRRFLHADSGAITVDWTVLAAAVVGLGVASVGAVRSGVGALGNDVSTSLSGASVASLGEMGSDGTLPFAYAPRHFSQADLDYSVQNNLLNIDQQGAAAILEQYRTLMAQIPSTPPGTLLNIRMDVAYAYYAAFQERGITIPPDIADFRALAGG